MLHLGKSSMIRVTGHVYCCSAFELLHTTECRLSASFESARWKETYESWCSLRICIRAAVACETRCECAYHRLCVSKEYIIKSLEKSDCRKCVSNLIDNDESTALCTRTSKTSEQVQFVSFPVKQAQFCSFQLTAPVICIINTRRPQAILDAYISYTLAVFDVISALFPTRPRCTHVCVSD